MDQQEKNIYVVAVSEKDNPAALSSAEAWLASISASVRGLQASAPDPQPDLRGAQCPAKVANGNPKADSPTTGAHASSQQANGAVQAELLDKSFLATNEPQAGVLCSPMSGSYATDDGLSTAGPQAEGSLPVNGLNGKPLPQKQLMNVREAAQGNNSSSEEASPGAVDRTGPDGQMSNGCTEIGSVHKGTEGAGFPGKHPSGHTDGDLSIDTVEILRLSKGGAHLGASSNGHTDTCDVENCSTAGPTQGIQEGQHAGDAVRPFKLRTSRRSYLENVKACLGYLHAGESYELCLTTLMVCFRLLWPV